MWINTSVSKKKKKKAKLKLEEWKFVFTVFLGKKKNVLVVVIFPHTQKTKFIKKDITFEYIHVHIQATNVNKLKRLH